MTSDTPDKDGRKWVKKKLVDTYADNIVITQRDGKNDVVAFRSAEENILGQLNDTEVPESNDMKRKILALAAKIIQEDVRAIPVNPDQYPRIDELDNVEKVIVAASHLFY